MAVKDKLVNLEDLKVVGDAVCSLKSAIIGLDGKTIDFKYPYFIGFNSPYKWGVSNGVYSYIIPVNGGDFVQFKSAATAARYAFLKSLTGATTSDTPDYATGYTQSVAVSANTSTAVTAPSDAKYLYMIAYDGSNSRAPVALSINGYDMFNSIIGNTSRDISVYRLNITSGTYAANLSDLNNAQVNTVYNLVFAPGTTTLPSHYPLDAYRGTVNTLLTLARHNGIGPIKAQYLFAEDVIYSRYADGSDNYTNWVLLYGSLPEWTPKAEKTLITASNYATKLSDCDNATLFKLYAINFAIGSTSIPANTPYGSSWAGELPLLFTYGAGNVKGQIWIDRKTVYTRYGANGTWYAWKIVGNNINENKVYTVDPNGAGDYTSFVECVKEAVKYKNSTVYVNQGDYDLVSEWGSSYLDGNDDDLGLMLGNGIHIIFSSNAKLTFNYTGSNTYILTEFAPFNADWQGSYLDYMLENMTLECSNCRYGIHDELHGTATRATHKYLNCHIDFDNTNNAEWSGDCIGGGLGSNAEIIVRNCVFKCLNNWENSPAFSWHNAKVPVAQNAKSRIVIDGCYCVGTAGSKKGTFRFGYYGYSQKITEIIICNNSFTLEPFFIDETQDDSPYENAEFVAWNNEIRNN